MKLCEQEVNAIWSPIYMQRAQRSNMVLSNTIKIRWKNDCYYFGMDNLCWNTKKKNKMLHFFQYNFLVSPLTCMISTERMVLNMFLNWILNQYQHKKRRVEIYYSISHCLQNRICFLGSFYCLLATELVNWT